MIELTEEQLNEVITYAPIGTGVFRESLEHILEMGGIKKAIHLSKGISDITLMVYPKPMHGLSFSVRPLREAIALWGPVGEIEEFNQENNKETE